MERRRYRWVLRLAAVLILGLIALLWAVGERTRTLSIENRSEQAIASLRITLADKSRDYQNVANNDEISVPCPARGDARFTVDGKLADGSFIRSSGRIGDGLQFVLLPGGHLQRKPKK